MNEEYIKIQNIYNDLIRLYDKKITFLKIRNNKSLSRDIINATSFLSIKSSISERIYCILNNLISLPTCKYCNTNKITEFKLHLFQYVDYCSECRSKSILQKRKETCLEKYGTDNVYKSDIIKNKIKETNIQKYGVDNPSKNKDIREKQKQTCLEKYGVDNPYKSEIVKEKIRQINLSNLNVEYPSQSPIVQEKIKQSSRERYGSDYFTQSEEYKKIQYKKSYEARIKFLKKIGFEPLFTLEEYTGTDYNKPYKFKCSTCNTERIIYLYNYYEPVCQTCFPFSKVEEDIRGYIKSLTSFSVNKSRTIISPLELDMYISELKLAIEYDSIYYHTELSGLKNKEYHVSKTNQCQDLGIRLIHIFEDEWYYKKQIVKNKLKYLFNRQSKTVYARDCIIKVIEDNDTKKKFLSKYHIQGDSNSNINLGMYYKNRLVAIMTFCSLRKSLGQTAKENYWELMRFTTIFNFRIIGAAGKLLSYFETNYKPEYIITYADRRWSSSSNLYEKIGFNLSHISSPNYWYTHKKFFPKREYRFKYRKSNLHKVLDIFDPDITEWENMKNNGYDRIWDCGNYVYVKKYSSTSTS